MISMKPENKWDVWRKKNHQQTADPSFLSSFETGIFQGQTSADVQSGAVYCRGVQLLLTSICDTPRADCRRILKYRFSDISSSDRYCPVGTKRCVKLKGKNLWQQTVIVG